MVTEVVKRLTPVETAAVQKQVDGIVQAPVASLDITSGRHFVFVAHFDGTNNDKLRPELSGSSFSTNIGAWSDLTERLKREHPENLRSEYFQGVGTNPGEGAWEAGLDPTASMRATASMAYSRFEVEASVWLAKHPEANPEEALQIVGTGFSRGSGTLAIFSQMLYEKGLVSPQTGQVLVPPGRLGLAAAMALEPVTTGYVGNDAFSPTSENIVAPRALNEYRSAFKGVDHSGHPNVTAPGVSGNHCDIGGGNDHGIGAMLGEAGVQWLRRSGLPVADLPPERQFSGKAAIHHERDMPQSEEANVAATLTLGYFGKRLDNRGDPLKMDYPVTHEPTQGLSSPRELTHDAEEAKRLGSTGWTQFQGVESTVYTKTFAHPRTGEPLEVALVKSSGPRGGQVEMYTSRLNEQGHAEATEHRSLGSAPVWEVMQVADQQLAARVTADGRPLHTTTLTPRLHSQVRDQLRDLAETDDLELPPHFRPLPPAASSTAQAGLGAANASMAQEQVSGQAVTSEEALAR
jgi:hypothetical protein